LPGNCKEKNKGFGGFLPFSVLDSQSFVYPRKYRAIAKLFPVFPFVQPDNI
jgi:hypothetical protein